MVEALPSSQGLFALRRIETPEPLDDFFFDPSYRNLIGSAREGRATVVNLVVGRDIKQLDMPGLPHLGSGISWNLGGRVVMATPLLKEGKISVLDMHDWSLIKTIDTPGPESRRRNRDYRSRLLCPRAAIEISGVDESVLGTPSRSRL